jgi:PAS domain-containing protein
VPPPEHGVDVRFEQLTARLILVALLAVAAATLLPWLVLPATSAFYLVVFGSLVGWTLLTYAVVAPRWPAGAGHVAFLITPVLLTWAALHSGGSLSPAFTTYSLVFISGASVLFPARYAWTSLLVVGGLGAWLAYADARGLLPAPWVVHTTHSRWLAVIGGGIVLFVVQQLETHWLRSALHAAKREVRQREETERAARVQQARFEELVSMVPGAMYEFEIDPAGRRRFTFISPGVEPLVGVRPDDVLQDPERLFRLVPPEELGPLDASIADSYVRLVPWRYEGTVVAVDGERKWFEGRAVPRRLADGTVRWYGVFSDQTERRRLEQQLLQAQKMEALGTLAGGIAHDFNNLLTVILGQAELARLLAGGQPDLVSALDEVCGAGTRASELVRQILDFSQPRAPEPLGVRGDRDPHQR